MRKHDVDEINLRIDAVKDLDWKLREEKRSALTKSVCRYCFYL